MSDHEKSDDPVGKLAELIEDIEIAMLTTAEEDGTLRSRPMATQKEPFDGELWFFTQASAPKVDEIEADRHVNLSYAQPKDQRYVSVSGTAQLVRDKAKAKQFWNPVLKAWFPDGLDDPDLALLRVRVSEAEYWDAKSAKLVQLAGLAKALITRQEYHPGENEKLVLER